MTKEKYALLSVFDKTGIVEFAKTLTTLGYSIISTGGTAKTLTENGITIIPIQDITGNPESFDGRMKTISFAIESGILFDRTNPKHVTEAKELGIKPIDIVVCNLYPFEQTISKAKVTMDEAIEQIDVGGPTMIRAAGKNSKSVLVVVDPHDYAIVAEYLSRRHSGRSNATDRIPLRDPIAPLQDDMPQDLAAKAFAHLSFYDAQIARYLGQSITGKGQLMTPQELTIAGRKTIDLRYGENPHQKAAVYFYPNTNAPLQHLTRLSGRELSHVNVTDINAGLESVRLFNDPCAVVIKHNCPCGIALGKNTKEALKRAIEADPESAFGGIIVLNQEMDLTAAEEIGKFKDERKANIDIVAVPSITDEALEYLAKLRKTMGIYTFGKIPKKRSHNEHIKYIDGGFIWQQGDNDIESGFTDWTVVTKKKPTKKQLEQMQIAWKFISRIKSNAILVMDPKLPMTRGIGTGQTSRIRSTRLALEQAGKYCEGAVLASDSFFPFDDSVTMAAKHGIAAIVQQGGSINDRLSIEAADKAGIAMVMTHRRAFWH